MNTLKINIGELPPSLEQIAELKSKQVAFLPFYKNSSTAIVLGFILSLVAFVPLWLSSVKEIANWFHEILVLLVPIQMDVIVIFSIVLAIFVPLFLFFGFWGVISNIKETKDKESSKISLNKNLIEVSPRNNPEQTKQIVEWANEFSAIKTYVQSIEGRYPIMLEYEEFERYVKLEKSKANKERLAKEAEVAYKELVNS